MAPAGDCVSVNIGNTHTIDTTAMPTCNIVYNVTRSTLALPLNNTLCLKNMLLHLRRSITWTRTVPSVIIELTRVQLKNI